LEDSKVTIFRSLGWRVEQFGAIFDYSNVKHSIESKLIYTDEGRPFHMAGTRIFGDGTFHCPHCGHRPLSSWHRRALARHIRNAEQQEYAPECLE
jgi:hypothetical protein